MVVGASKVQRNYGVLPALAVLHISRYIIEKILVYLPVVGYEILFVYWTAASALHRGLLKAQGWMLFPFGMKRLRMHEKNGRYSGQQ